VGEARRRAVVADAICDGCTMCCDLFPVHALGKDAGRRCVHADAAGCGIHGKAERPAVCSAYECRYRSMARIGRGANASVPSPREAGAFFHEEPDRAVFSVFVDPLRAEQWKRTGIAGYLAVHVGAGFAVVVVDRGFMMTLRTPAEWADYLSRDCVDEAVGIGVDPNYDGRAKAAD
jgi:hypothetical protein